MFADKVALKRRKRRRIVLRIMIGLFLFLGSVMAYKVAYKSGRADRAFSLYVRNTTTLDDVQKQLTDSLQLRDPDLWGMMARVIRLDSRLQPGHYLLSSDMSLVTILKVLYGGVQTPIKLTFHSTRTQEQLIEKLTKPLQMTTEELSAVLTDAEQCASFGLDTTTIRCLFLPDTYEVYWTITPQELLKKFQSRYNQFWTTERRELASRRGLTPVEASIIASIVEEESNKKKEYPNIAGLYINRLRTEMPLQADPTVKFAWGDFSIRRITHDLLSHPSPYNTYRHKGLPPGPIRYPEAGSIDSVLNYAEHDFRYMCAKSDFSGYHDFAATYAEHKINAQRYQQELNKRNILR